jgi:hypothetical protein
MGQVRYREPLIPLTFLLKPSQATLNATIRLWRIVFYTPA